MHFRHKNDYESRYRQTYIGKVSSGRIVPIYVSEVYGTDKEPKFRGHEVLPDGNLSVYEVDFKFRDPDLILPAPKLGMSGNNGVLYYISRLPRRRWKQGFDHEAYQTKSFVAPPRGVRMNVYDLFNPVNVPLDQAITILKQYDTYGLRITRNIGIFKNKGKVGIAYGNQSLGSVTDDGKLLLVPDSEMLVDTFKRIGFTDVVVTARPKANPKEKIQDLHVDKDFLQQIAEVRRAFGEGDPAPQEERVQENNDVNPLALPQEFLNRYLNEMNRCLRTYGHIFTRINSRGSYQAGDQHRLADIKSWARYLDTIIETARGRDFDTIRSEAVRLRNLITSRLQGAHYSLDAKCYQGPNGVVTMTTIFKYIVVTSVLSRTMWDPITSAVSSILIQCQERLSLGNAVPLQRHIDACQENVLVRHERQRMSTVARAISRDLARLNEEEREEQDDDE
jgi:hypothetical protein